MNRKLMMLISLPLLIALIAGSSLVGSLIYRWAQDGYSLAAAALLVRALIVVIFILFAKHGEWLLREELRARRHRKSPERAAAERRQAERRCHELN